LADRLDQVLPPHQPGVAPTAAGDDSLVDLAVRLARGPHPVLDAPSVAQIQAQILARADKIVFAGARNGWQPRGLLRWAVAACLIVALLLVSTASVSAQSLPGETLYPVKRLVEQGRIALSGDSGEVGLRLQFADRRLDEFEELLDEGTVRLDTLDDAVDEMNTALSLVEDGAGSRQDAASRLVDLSERHVALAERARPRLEPDGEQVEQLQGVAEEAEQVGQEARDLVAATDHTSSMLPKAPYIHGRQSLHSERLVYAPQDLSQFGNPVVAADETMVIVAPAMETHHDSAALVFELPPTQPPVKERTPVPATLEPTPVPTDDRGSAGEDPPVTATEPPVVVTDPPITPEPTQPPAATEPPVEVTPLPTDPPATLPTEVLIEATPEPTDPGREAAGEETVTPLPTDPPLPDLPTEIPITPEPTVDAPTPDAAALEVTAEATPEPPIE
jgi:hypothetical protein